MSKNKISSLNKEVIPTILNHVIYIILKYFVMELDFPYKHGKYYKKYTRRDVIEIVNHQHLFFNHP